MNTYRMRLNSKSLEKFESKIFISSLNFIIPTEYIDLESGHFIVEEYQRDYDETFRGERLLCVDMSFLSDVFNRNAYEYAEQMIVGQEYTLTFSSEHQDWTISD